MKEFRITVNDDGAVEVWEGERTSGVLTVGEMIEQVLFLTGAKIKRAYPMDTPEGWARRFKPLGAQAKKTGEQDVNSGNSVSQTGT